MMLSRVTTVGHGAVHGGEAEKLNEINACPECPECPPYAAGSFHMRDENGAYGVCHRGYGLPLYNSYFYYGHYGHYGQRYIKALKSLWFCLSMVNAKSTRCPWPPWSASRAKVGGRKVARPKGFATAARSTGRLNPRAAFFGARAIHPRCHPPAGGRVAPKSGPGGSTGRGVSFATSPNSNIFRRSPCEAESRFRPILRSSRATAAGDL